MTEPAITLSDIREAQERIAPYIVDTPLCRASALEELTGADIYLKPDTLQPTGSFKFRGACNAIAHLDSIARAKGVVTASTGNFGRALAYAAKLQDVPATVCVSELVPHNKVAAIKALGADMFVYGKGQDDAGEKARELARDKGMKLVSPFDDFHVIAGQGTIGLEIINDLPEVDIVLVPLSGGGLIAGIALALRSISPDIQVIGISTEQCPAMIESLKAGKPVDIEERPSVADSLGGSIGLDNRHSFAIMQEHVGLDNVLTLSEEEIREGMRHLFYQEQLVVEGAAAVGVAALLSGKIEKLAGELKGKRIVCHVSGKNIDMDDFVSIMTERAAGERLKRHAPR